ncbi:MAG: ATP-binding protein, partial [Actinobacteria bacterium]|nr:ATP-binding protein [Actinomycetota bacterium]
MLEPTEDDPVINPALSLELARDRITLPRLADLGQVALSGLLDRVRAAVATKNGWLVSETAVLSCFPPMKEAMYQDLLDHEDLVAAHPVVRALAVGGRSGDEPALGASIRHEPGEGVAGENAPVILDANAEQRACIMAALAGRSFTMDGPPGTGKSQTIANMIGALLHAGKTALLVSEKAAALDVVAERLTAAGLGGYLLELHSDKAARKRVAASLAGALDPVPAAVPPSDRETARNQREQLREYAYAVNRVRDPLGYSLHDVLAMIASLRTVPAAPATGPAPVRVTEQMLGEIRRAAASLAAAWRPAAQGRSYAWRGVIEQGSMDGRLYEAASALETLARVARGNQVLADATGLTRPSDAHVLAQLLDHLLTWPEGMPDEWLTVDTLDVAEAAVTQVTGGLTAIAARETQASRAAGVPWSAIPRRAALPEAGSAALAALKPACVDVSSLGAGQITGLARDFSATADLLERWLGAICGLAATLGLQAPVTFSNANDLLAVARLTGELDRPERAWLSVPGQRAASNAAQALYDAHRALAGAEAAARGYFTPDALRQDLTGLAARFANHQGLGRLSAAYRADKRIVAAFTKEGVAEETALGHLGLAVAWKNAADGLAAAESRYAALLGPHYAGRATDFARLDRVLTNAATAVRCARGQDLSRAADYISRDAAPNGAVSGAVAEARQHLSAWQAALAPPPAIAPRPELRDGTIREAIGWLRAHLGPLQTVSEFTHVIDEVAGRPLTFGQARQLVGLREAAESARAQLAERDAIFREVCGQLYAGAATDVMALRGALEWARRLRTMITGGPGPLTPAHLDAVESAVPADRLAKAADAWQENCAALLAAFSPQRRPELAAELDDYSGGYQLLEAMFNDPGGREVWHAYQAARASLAAHGMDAAVDFCIAERIEPAQVPQVIERALLQEWADYHLRADPALAPLLDAGRDALADRCQQLDRALMTAAAEDVIGACNRRHPRNDTSESAVIRMEAAKKSGHMPVRELLDQARHLTQAVKPCILATPLAVSQYLPAGLNFDVVIFDEASQISPADAINGIYRGNCVILAGDQRQLPPASGSSSIATGDGEQWPADFEGAPDIASVLDIAKGSGAFGNLTLRWHYRSRHEALIAFPNAAFYDGRLRPVPGGGPEAGGQPEADGGPEAGIDVLYGEGTYPGPAARDNPGEAARVAHRVIHHYTTRPDLSLGVVTFSEAQAEAIETALGKARKLHPGLDRFFGPDRLRGFFVKSAAAAQGDERDVLILSVGYGPDEKGQVTKDFGPLSGPVGWRMLNVAVTRARYRAEIVSSIHASDIPQSATGDGV